MANVINKATLQYLKAVNTVKYLDENWLINPVLPDCEKKYWKIKNDLVVEMTKKEKTAVDVVIAAQKKDAQKETLIMAKQQEISRAEAIQALKDDGVLDSNGNLKGG